MTSLCLQKIQRLQQYLKQKKISAALFFSGSIGHTDPSFYYLCGIHVEGALLFVPLKGRSYLFVPAFEKSRLQKEWKGGVVLSVYPMPLLTYITKHWKHIKTLGVDEMSLTLHQFKILKKQLKQTHFIDLSNALQDLRMIKLTIEQKIIQKGYRITCSILASCIDEIRRGTLSTEKEACLFLESAAKKNGDGVSF